MYINSSYSNDHLAGKDFGPSQHYTVTFPIGLKKQSLKVPIINDNVNELDETFRLQISVPDTVIAAGVTHGCHPSVTVKIIDDDCKFYSIIN